MTQQLALNEGVENVSSSVYLNHKVLNDPMESGAFIAQGNAIFPLLPRAKLPKVLRRIGNNVSKEFHLYPPSVLSSDRHVKKYYWILLFARFPCSRHFSNNCAIIIKFSPRNKNTANSLDKLNTIPPINFLMKASAVNMIYDFLASVASPSLVLLESSSDEEESEESVEEDEADWLSC